MAAIQDHGYLTACAKLASYLSISLSAAKRKVELVSQVEGFKKDAFRQKEIAERLLKEALLLNKEGGKTEGAKLDDLLIASPEDENFMIED